jgi:hypothetical protein
MRPGSSIGSGRFYFRLDAPMKFVFRQIINYPDKSHSFQNAHRLPLE